MNRPAHPVGAHTPCGPLQDTLRVRAIDLPARRKDSSARCSFPPITAPSRDNPSSGTNRRIRASGSTRVPIVAPDRHAQCTANSACRQRHRHHDPHARRGSGRAAATANATPTDGRYSSLRRPEPRAERADSQRANTRLRSNRVHMPLRAPATPRQTEQPRPRRQTREAHDKSSIERRRDRASFSRRVVGLQVKRHEEESSDIDETRRSP